jgi:predicted dehydrogenase
MAEKRVGVAIIGVGGVSLANHLPGLALIPGVELVALCDPSQEALARAGALFGVETLYRDPQAVMENERVDAVVIATPNRVHRGLVLAAVGAGKHVMCEKPLALNTAEALEMYGAAEKAGVRHMTAFTYRFVPAMRYMKALVDQGYVGQPIHFRAQRFQDWGVRHLGWRQLGVEAGSGELGDMLSHRLDFGHLLMGPMVRVTARLKQLVDTRHSADGTAYKADVDDWAACLADFANGATGVFESTKLATARGDGSTGHDWCEVNGIEGSLAYRLGDPHRLQMGRQGGALEPVDVPEEFLKLEGSPRDVKSGDPLQGFRYDQSFEFISAIRQGRPCSPSFKDGVLAQAVMDAIIESAREDRGVPVRAGLFS